MSTSIDLSTISYEEIRAIAQSCMQNSQWENAILCWKQLEKIDVQNRDVLHSLADCYINTANYEQAYQYLNKCLLFGTTVASIYNQLGIISIQFFQNLNQAIPYFIYAKSLNPVDPTIDSNLNRAIQLTGKKKVKVQFFPDYRIGHLALEPNLWMRKLQLDPHYEEDSYIVTIKSGNPSNKTLMELYNPHFNILEHGLLHDLFIQRAPLLNLEYYAPFPYNLLNMSLDQSCQMEEIYSNDLFQGTSSTLSFSEEQHEKGREGLRKLGLDPKKDWYVTIFARDDAYLESLSPGNNWSHHNFRNCDIHTYHAAIRWITEQGGWVIRLGSETNQELGFNHPKVIDYPVEHRAQLDGDFMDIYLAMNAKFMIGQFSGITDVGMANDVPTLVVNTAPVIPPYNVNNLYIPKRMQRLDTQESIPFSELYSELDGIQEDKEARLFWCNSNELAEAGFVYVDNTEEEILEATKEMFSRVSGKFQPSEEEKELQENYHSLFPQSHWLSRNKTPIGIHFLKTHRELFLAPQAVT